MSIDFDNDVLDCSLICRYILGRILMVHGMVLVTNHELKKLFNNLEQILTTNQTLYKAYIYSLITSGIFKHTK